MREIRVRPGLELKELRAHHADHVFKTVDANRSSLRQWLPWLDQNQKVEDTMNFIHNTGRSNSEGSSLILGIFFEGEFCGMVSYNAISRVNHIGFVGYWLSTAFRGRGIMRDSVRALVSFGFQNLSLNRVEIHVAVENFPSKRIPEALGFKSEGIMRQAGYLYGRYEDVILFAMLRSEWTSATSH